MARIPNAAEVMRLLKKPATKTVYPQNPDKRLGTVSAFTPGATKASVIMDTESIAASYIYLNTYYPNVGDRVMLEKVGNTWVIMGGLGISPIIVTAIKTSDTSRNTTITVANDPHLTVPVAANENYIVEAFFRYSAGNTAGDFRFNYAVPSGATYATIDMGAGNAGAVTNVNAEIVDLSVFSVNDRGRGANIDTDRGVVVKGYLSTSSTAGSFTMQWAQVVSNASNVTLKTGSWLKLTRT